MQRERLEIIRWPNKEQYFLEKYVRYFSDLDAESKGNQN